MVQLSSDEFYLVVLAVSWVGGFLPLLFRKRMTWVQCVGLALLISPFVRMGINLLRTFPILFGPPVVLQPASEAALWRTIDAQIWYNFALPFIGLILLHNPFRDAGGEAHKKERLVDALASHGAAPKRSWRADVQRGLSLFPFIAVAYLLAYTISLYVAPILSPGSDESLYWRNITIPLIVLLALSAGLAEEFLFRGILLSSLSRWMPWGIAAFAQALFFGLIHAGYGNWAHVIGPAAFGLGMAWVARNLGIVVTVLLHAEVNIVFLTVDRGPTYLAVNGALGLAALLSVSIILLALCAWSLRETKADAVRLLWRDLLRMLGLSKAPRPEEEIVAAERA